MDFTFSEDQLALQQTVREFLEGECSAGWIRAQWDTESGRSPEFWKKLAEIGITGLLDPEAMGGLEMDEIDFVLLLEEIGRAALPDPVIATALVGTRLLQEMGSDVLQETWLPRIASGEAVIATGSPVNPFVADAHIADLILLPGVDAIRLLSPGDLKLTPQKSNDPSRRIFTLEWDDASARIAAEGDRARQLCGAALDRGAMACSAQALGVCDKLITMSAEYAGQRKQFGVPIGSFQAVKHMLANVKVELEYARSLVYRAAHSVAHASDTRSVDVSMAKLAACEAASHAAKTSLQVHGAIGYTWEQDLHIWMRRAWSLDLAWGDRAFHRARVTEGVIDGTSAAEPFGYSAPGGPT